MIRSYASMSEKEESEGSNLEGSLCTPVSSPFQQVPANETLPRDSQFDNCMHSNGHPYIKILEEPQDQFRFRYMSEGGDHGFLHGDSSSAKNKTFPTVELRNYNEKAVIKCKVYQHDNDLEHPHRLFYGHIGNNPIAEVSEGNGYIVPFKRLRIIQTKKKDLRAFEEFEGMDEKTLRKYCSSIDWDRVRLRFSAHDPLTDKELCSVLSRTICNKNIVVNIFEENSNGKRVWNAAADIVEMHHQFGICIRTPRYTYIPEDEMTSCVDVWMELVGKDGRRSDPVKFRYSPAPHQLLKKRARKRTATSAMNDAPPLAIAIANPAEPDLILTFDPTVGINDPRALQSAGEYFERFDPVEPRQETMSVEQINGAFNQAPNDSDDFQEFLDNNSDLLEKYLSQGEEDAFMAAQEVSKLVSDKPHPSKHSAAVLLCGASPALQQVPDTDHGSLTPEDILEIQALIKDILYLKQKKLREWHKEVTEKMETLFEMRMSNGETILHVLLRYNEAGLRRLVSLATQLGRSDLLSAQRASDGLSVLHIATVTQRAGLACWLLHQGCDPLCGDWAGDNAIHYAVSCGGSILQPLLQAMYEKCGRDKRKMELMLRLSNYQFQTPLWLAVDRQCIKSIQLLLEYYDPDRGIDDECQGRSPLDLAVELHRADIVKMLLQVTPRGAACLNKCVRAAHSMSHSEAIVAMLLEHGADPMPFGDMNIDRALSDSDTSSDDYLSADDGDSDASEEDIATKLKAVKLNNQSQ